MRLVFVRESDLDRIGGVMTSLAFSPPAQPMTEAKYLALGETVERVELFDGSVFVSPAPTPRHQLISTRLIQILGEAAKGSGLSLFHDINVRLRPEYICIPDLAVTAEIDVDDLVVDANAVRLVCEITSPSNAANDRVLKMNYYAAAGIPWYLLIEQDSAALHLYQLAGDTYLLHSLTSPGDVLNLVEPLVANIDPEELVRRH
jgi:Uma2 family endonuclease